MDFIICRLTASFNRVDTIETKYNVIPSGMLYLAESLLNTGFSVSLLHDDIENILKDIRKITTSDTIAFGISTLSGLQLKNSIKLAKRLKKEFPGKPIIWGGVHVTALPLETLSNAFVDFVVWGEGEQSLPQLLDAIKKNKDFSNIKGIGYKRSGQTFLNENIGYTPLNRVFNMPYHLLDMNKYARQMNIGVKRGYPMYTSRGCPYRCKFCSNASKLWPNTKIRYYPVEHVINDIKVLVDVYKADCITFVDELFVFEERRVVEICHAIKKNGMDKLKFRASSRADILSRFSRDTWELMKDTGFVGMAVGMESGSQSILDFIGKGTTLEQIYKADAMLTEYHFNKSYSFMSCIPGETISDVVSTLKLITNLARTSKYCPYPFTIMNKFLALPNTELFDIAVDNGFEVPRNIHGWTVLDHQLYKEEVLRPWVTKQHMDFVDRGNGLILELNHLFTGEGADHSAIECTIKKIEALIEDR
jgi:anaerobic magnesium-protoporphyrin IX monomethyl ester cyclase